jgi:rhodanese-related sulfurtransferase
VPAGTGLASFRRATFADLAEHGTEQVVVFDVRRDSERATGHIEGSVHIPVDQLHQRIGEIPQGTVWVHCAGGMHAGIDASLLDAAGRDVVAVDDGFGAAADAGLRLVSG